MEILIKNESKKSTYVNPRKKISAESQRYADEAPVIDNSYVPQPQNNDSAPTKTKNVVPFNATHKKIRSGIIALFFITLTLDIVFSVLYYVKVFNVNLYINLISGIAIMIFGLISFIISLINARKVGKSKMPRKVLPIILLVLTVLSAINLMYSGFMIGPAIMIFRM